MLQLMLADSFWLSAAVTVGANCFNHVGTTQAPDFQLPDVVSGETMLSTLLEKRRC